MGRLIWRQMMYERGRTLFVCVAIAATLAVVLLLEGFQQGLFTQLRQVVLKRGADLIVTQAGVSNFIASRSNLRQLSRIEVEAVDGVREAHPMTLLPVIYDNHGRKTPIFFVVYDTVGGPSPIVKGTSIRAQNQIVIDKSLADLHGLTIGSAFVVADYEFSVTGITRDAAAMFTPFAFITYDDLIDFYFNSDLVGDISNLALLSFLLVDLDSGADARRVAMKINAAVPDVDVFRPAALAENDAALGKTLFGPVMNALISISYLICLLVISIIMFAAVNSRRRSFGVLKALGFSQVKLAVGMLLEVLILTSVAFPLAVIIALAIARLIEVNEPLYLLSVMQPLPFLRTVIAGFLVAIVGALLPIHLISGLDPMTVFRG